MPCIKIHWNNPGDGWGIWRIEETEQFFSAHMHEIDACPLEITNDLKRLEWLCGRFLLKKLFEEAGQVYHGILKNEQGRPFPVQSSYQISLTNSFPFVAAQIHPSKSVGVDIERLRPKLNQVVGRILSSDELHDAGTDLRKLCVYWSAKESLLKISGNKNFIFSEELRIEPFEIKSEGTIMGSIRRNGLIDHFMLNYMITNDFVLTTTFIPA